MKINLLKQRFLKGIQEFKSLFPHDTMLKKEQKECLVIFPSKYAKEDLPKLSLNHIREYL